MLIGEFKHDLIKLLRGFYGVAKSGSLGRTSALLGRNRSAISHQIKRLEGITGVTLFDRSQRRMTLTAEGLKLLKLTESAFDILNSVTSKEFWEDELSGHLNIRVGNATATTFLPPLLAAFSDAFPGITYTLFPTVTEPAGNALRSGAMDVNFGFRNEDATDLEYEAMFSEPCVLVAPGDGRFHLSKRPSFTEISALPFIGQNYKEGTSKRIEAIFRASGHPLQVRLRCDSFKLALRFVREGMGVSIMYKSVYETEKDGVVTHPLEGVVPDFEVGMITRRGGYQSPQLAAFVGFVRQNRETFIRTKR